jgi:hypothetical protein
MNHWQAISDHYTCLSELFRSLGRKESADYYAGMARTYQRLAEAT